MLTAKNVPGRKTMPMYDMALIWLLSLLEAKAMMMFALASRLV